MLINKLFCFSELASSLADGLLELSTGLILLLSLLKFFKHLEFMVLFSSLPVLVLKTRNVVLGL